MCILYLASPLRHAALQTHSHGNRDAARVGNEPSRGRLGSVRLGGEKARAWLGSPVHRATKIGLAGVRLASRLELASEPVPLSHTPADRNE
jgi:hypothetical protein